MAPHQWQVNASVHLLKMKKENTSRPTFLCQPTGGGKSSVRHFCHCGRHFLVFFSFAFAANGSAVEAGKTFRCQRQNICRVQPYDYSQDSGALHSIVAKMQRTSGLKATVLFLSPQLHSSRPTPQNLFKNCLNSNKCCLVNVDEAHLFVQFGLYFRNEFSQLKENLFALMKRPDGSFKAPTLFVTATATKSVLHRLQRIAGLNFGRCDLLWPLAKGMHLCKVNLVFHFTTKPVRCSQRYLPHHQLPNNGEMKQHIVFANSRIKWDKLHNDVRNYLDSLKQKGDVVKITDSLFPEQKSFYLFLNPSIFDKFNDSVVRQETGFSFDMFSCVGCFATWTLGSAGWDRKDVMLVLSVDWPTDLISASQEKGCPACYPQANPNDNHYVVCGSLKSYQYLMIKRMHLKKKRS